MKSRRPPVPPGTRPQTGEHDDVDVLGKLGPTATLLWTSAIKLKGVPLAHTKELCSLINAALRDDIEARPPAAKHPTLRAHALCGVHSRRRCWLPRGLCSLRPIQTSKRDGRGSRAHREQRIL